MIEIYKNFRYNLSKKLRPYKAFIKYLFRKNLVLSIGENCLTENIIERNGLKSFSTPYSSGRSNVEYAIHHESTKFAYFLDPEFFVSEPLEGKNVIRNKKIVDTVNSYQETCVNGFEFTHHDVLNNKKIRKTMLRRCKRMLKLKNKNLFLVYHHRMCSDTDEKLLLKHMKELKQIYENRGNNVQIFIYTQRIVSAKEERRAEFTEDDNIYFYEFYTMDEWAGNDEDIFWAVCDNDLLESMIGKIKQNMNSSK